MSQAGNDRRAVRENDTRVTERQNLSEVQITHSILSHVACKNICLLNSRLASSHRKEEIYLITQLFLRSRLSGDQIFA